MGDARNFLKNLVFRTQELPLLIPDELPLYADSLKELFHKIILSKPMGRPGRRRYSEDPQG